MEQSIKYNTVNTVFPLIFSFVGGGVVAPDRQNWGKSSGSKMRIHQHVLLGVYYYCFLTCITLSDRQGLKSIVSQKSYPNLELSESILTYWLL